MKTTFRRIVLGVAMLSALGASAQSASSIYGQLVQDPFTPSAHQIFIGYDYTTGLTDTIANFHGAINDTFAVAERYVAMDVLNGRYFWFAKDSGNFQTAGYHLYTIDLAGHSYTTGAAVSGKELGEMEYDIYQNKLVFRNWRTNLFKAYDIASGSFDTLSTLPDTFNNVNALNDRAYNPFAQQYLAATYSNHLTVPGYGLQLIDGVTGALIDSMSTPNGFCQMVCNPNTQKFYGLEGNATISEINPFTGATTTVVSIPGYSSTGQMDAVFDGSNNTMILPYLSPVNLSRLSIINVSTNAIVGDYPAPFINIARGGSITLPALKAKSTTLTAPYARSYEWYRNDTLISGASAQSYTVTTPGLYKARLTFFNGKTKYSNTKNFPTLGITPAQNLSVLVYPNPAKDFITVEGAQGGSAIVQSIVGQQVMSATITGNKQVISLSGLPTGTYMLVLTKADGTISSIRITKE